MATGREVLVPDIGDYSDVPVIELLVAVGDTVQRDQGLVSLESDKATMEVPAPFAGVVRELKVAIGDSVSEGSVVAVIEEAEAAASSPAKGDRADTDAAPAKAPAADAAPAKGAAPAASPEPADDARPASTAAVAAAPQPAPSAGPTRSPPVSFGADSVDPKQVPYASPAVRLFARELGVDLSKVPGKGRGGRVLKEDVQAFVKGALAGGAPRAPTGGGGGLDLLPWPKVDFSKFGPVESLPLSRIKKLSGANLARNWAMIPHVTQFEQADITEMEAFRKKLGEENKDTKITPLVFLIKAAVAALKKFPTFNASLDASGETLTLKQYVHIGIAVDTPDGLVVPVIRDCDRKGLLQLAAELGEISRKARDRKLGPAEMSGGCFSISSLGGIGGSAFTPIINAPEVAILGVSKSAIQPVWNGKEFQPRLMLPLSLSYDHRVIDGAEAARFAAYLAQQLGDIRRLLL
jgi:pyruvate dehydrogenase E2 component (dihydrolipoamide acetyltransferase)